MLCELMTSEVLSKEAKVMKALNRFVPDGSRLPLNA
jgi:hypothetical protein